MAKKTDAQNEIMIADEQLLRSKVYVIRGQRVMLDFDLALIYGYSVSAFNQQVKRNAERFPADFTFDLTPEEMRELSKSQNVISIQTTGVKGGRSKPIKAFTEQGIYMLMTVLKGELMAYQKIYRKATKNIIVIDDYLGVKTLYHLATAKKNVDLTIVSDNKGRHPLRKAEYDDFETEYPGRVISFISTAGRTHDRYIILDYGTSSIMVYHCGASSKDAGRRITTITEIKDVDEYKNTVKALLSNPPLVLR